MSGHSKWSTIKRQKEATDKKKGVAFSKHASAIAIAAREGGSGDIESNFRLRLAVERARAVNMPKENIERAIAKGTGVGGEGVLEEVLYEGFTPVSGVAMLVTAVTDKKQRTTPELKSLVEKNGGVFGSTGTASHYFDFMGEVVVEKKDLSFDAIFDVVVDAGAEEVEDRENVIVVLSQPNALQKVQQACRNAEFTILDAGLVYIPKMNMEIDEEAKNRVVGFVDAIEEHDDVQSVFVNTVI